MASAGVAPGETVVSVVAGAWKEYWKASGSTPSVMRSNCTKVLPPSTPVPPVTPPAVASSVWFRSVPRSSAWMMVSAVAGVLMALSCAVGR